MITYLLWNLCQCRGDLSARLFGHFVYHRPQSEDHNPIIPWTLYKLLHVLHIKKDIMDLYCEKNDYTYIYVAYSNILNMLLQVHCSSMPNNGK